MSDFVQSKLKFKVRSSVREQSYLQQQEKRHIFPICFEV